MRKLKLRQTIREQIRNTLLTESSAKKDEGI